MFPRICICVQQGNLFFLWIKELNLKINDNVYDFVSDQLILSFLQHICVISLENNIKIILRLIISNSFWFTKYSKKLNYATAETFYLIWFYNYKNLRQVSSTLNKIQHIALNDNINLNRATINNF